MTRSARPRSCRAISIGSLLSTSRETSRSNSYSADRISASMIYDGQIFLLAADQAGDTVPAAHGALARVHARHSIKHPSPAQACLEEYGKLLFPAGDWQPYSL